MGEPPAKRIHLEEEAEDEVDADVPSAVTYANGGVGGLKDILAYHSGTLPTTLIEVENIHQINLTDLPDWQFYCLPLAHYWWYFASGKNTTGDVIQPAQFKHMYTEMMDYGCKILSCSMGLHELRGTSTSETTVGSTVTQKTINDSHPELEYYVDTNRNFSKLYYDSANDEDFLKATDPTLPIVEIAETERKDYGTDLTVWRPTTPFYLFNNRSVLHKEDTKTWHLSSDNSRWYSLQYNVKYRLPYNAPGYKWGEPADGLERPAISRAANDPTAVYFRVKQIEKSNKVTCLLKTNTKLLVQQGYKGIYAKEYKDCLHTLPNYVSTGGKYEDRHIFAWNQ